MLDVDVVDVGLVVGIAEVRLVDVGGVDVDVGVRRVAEVGGRVGQE